MPSNIENRLYDIQLRLYRVELKLDDFLSRTQNDAKLAVLTQKLNTASGQLEKAVEDAQKVLPPLPPAPPE